MTRPRLLDLFCGAGGASMGYHLAGFEVIGVDIAQQPRYPFEWYKGDALDLLPELVERYRPAVVAGRGDPARVHAVHRRMADGPI